MLLPPPRADDVPGALAGIFDKKPATVSVSGQLLANAHTDEFDGAELTVVIGNLKIERDAP